MVRFSPSSAALVGAIGVALALVTPRSARAAESSIAPFLGPPPASVLAAPAALDPAPPPPPKKPPISLQITPYFWLGNISGEVGVGDFTAEADFDFDDLLSNLDFGAMVAFEAREGKWGLLLDAMYMKLSNDADPKGGVFDDADITAEELLLGGAFAYRVADQGSVWGDVLAGVRYWNLDTEVELDSSTSPDVDVDESEDWFDPFVGGRMQFDLGSKFYVMLYGDIGGFDVGSKLTWQLLGTVGFRVSDSVALVTGYRYLDVDFEDGDFVFDTVTQGILVGATFSW